MTRLFSSASALYIILAIFAASCSAKDYELYSPDRSQVIRITVGPEVAYSVWHNEVQILQECSIGLGINGRDFSSAPIVKGSSEQSVDRLINPVVAEKRSSIVDAFNELRIDFASNWSLVFRAYDDGIAYRIEIDLPGNVSIDDEHVEYCFAKNFQTTVCVRPGFYSHYEGPYTTFYMDDLKDDDYCLLPQVIHADENVSVAIVEASLHDYAGLYLKKGDVEHQLVGVLPKYPATYGNVDDRNEEPVTRRSYIARTNGRRTLPWRGIIIADTDEELLDSQLVYKLSDENALKETDWIVPGKVIWDWYNANNIFGVDFEAGINTDTYKYYIDFASKYGIEYVLLDEGWYDIKTEDLSKPIPEIDLPEIVRYGKEKGVGVILWVTWKTLHDQFEEALDQFEEWGICGVKVDFMQRDDQWMVNLYEKIARECADRKMLVDFHGSYKPTGLRRKYPNVITREGVVGLEYNKFGKGEANPQHDVTIPFTRMLAGPMDYTPGAMVNAQLDNYFVRHTQPMSLGTRCHQLAMYVIYESPLQMLADSPSKYLLEPKVMDFLSPVPSVWDETHFIEAEFGEYLVVARQKDQEWYVGAMTNWTPRDIKLGLAFLPTGTYNIQIFADGKNAERYASDFHTEKKQVSSSQTLDIHMAPGGGWAARITPQ